MALVSGSLARTLLNGGVPGGTIDASKYDHKSGGLRIAMESVEELHDIFMEGYESEQIELAAAYENITVEESTKYSEVMEGVVKNALSKAKDFIMRLWEKVKAFFHSIKRFLDALFKSTKDFCKDYENDIKNASVNFTFNMFNYTNVDDGFKDPFPTKELDDKCSLANSALSQHGISNGGKSIKDGHFAAENRKTGQDVSNDKTDTTKDAYKDKLSSMIDALNTEASPDNMAAIVASSLLGNTSVNDASDLDKAIFGYFRGGATGKDDKKKVTITSLSTYSQQIVNSKATEQLAKAQSSVDEMFRKSIDLAKTAETKFGSFTGGKSAEDGGKFALYQSVMSSYTKFLSSMQTSYNKCLTGWKTVIKERDSEYKKLIMAGIHNDGKSNDDK